MEARAPVKCMMALYALQVQHPDFVTAYNNRTREHCGIGLETCSGLL